MREIHVYPLPSMAEKHFVLGSAAVVIDVLRATSVVVSALHSGVKEIFPVLEIEDALRLKRELLQQSSAKILLGGERKGVPITGFDLGNSPQDYTPERVGGATLIFTTTNGTMAMHAARPARKIYCAAFLNARAVVEKLACEMKISIFCAGTDGFETEEDVLLAGCLVSRLMSQDERCRLNSFAEMVAEQWKAVGNGELAGLLRQSRGGRNLIALGLAADIEAAAQIDLMDIMPELEPETMRITLRAGT